MYQDKKLSYLSVRGTQQLCALFSYAKELLGVEELYQVLSIAEKEYVLHGNKIEQGKLNKLKINYTYDGTVPVSLKIRVEDTEIDAQVNTILKNRYQVTTIQTPWKLKILLQTLICLLEQSSKYEESNETLNALRIRLIELAVEETNIEKIKKSIEIFEEVN